jgi:flagellar basal body-associated protein FliL
MKLYRILLIILCLLVAAILGGTVFAFVSGKVGPAQKTAAPASGLAAGTAPATTGTVGATGAAGTGSTAALASNQAFASLGQLRAQTKDGATVVVSIAFPYNPQDKAFAEELSGKLDSFRNITGSYFEGLEAAKINTSNDGGVKNDLLKLFNAQLRLGRLQALYFSDYMLLK